VKRSTISALEAVLKIRKSFEKQIEPSNDLDVETLRALEDALLEFAGVALVISHDRWFLDRICTHILAAEGDSQWTFFAGNYHDYEEDKKKRLGEEGARPRRPVPLGLIGG
jgi:sulfate-transporting ATPase